MYDTRKDNIWLFIIVFFAVATLGGCAGTVPPSGWLPAASELERDRYGGWLLLQIQEGNSAVEIQGEFIAVQDSTVCFFTIEGHSRFVLMSTIKKARLQIHGKESGKVAGWTVGGIVSTVSHGFVLILTAPAWLLTGTISTISASYLGDYEKVNPDRTWWNEMSKFARFPQGLPEGLDISQLHGKPFQK